jgi:hypothetical protein
MYAGVVDVKALNDYVLLLSFDNCEERLFDMKPLLSIGRFSELQDIAEFNRVSVSFDTIQWSNGLDLDPEYLYIESTPITQVQRRKMKKIKLDKYEQDIENNIQEYKSISPSEKKLVTVLIKKANNKKN